MHKSVLEGRGFKPIFLIKFPISQRNREFQLPELRFVKDVHLLEDA
ncbi:hypothetical protein [Desmonostoc muscorum]|nr:hypothetical protein [Desmonostoc muscorum]